MVPYFAFSWVLPEGSLDGSDWNSNVMKGKTFILYYVNISKRNINNEASERLKAQNFDPENFGAVAIINLKGTWIPNGIIMNGIKKKQKKYPGTIYLKDKNRHMYDILNLKPSGNDIFAFDETGKEIFRHQGRMSDEDTTRLIKLVSKEVKD
jgi:hypothetical protein